MRDSVSDKWVMGVGVRLERSASRRREVVENAYALQKRENGLVKVFLEAIVLVAGTSARAGR
jgi:hypothetical protein